MTMSRERARRRGRSRGVAALELALSLIFIVPLMLGILDYGYYFYIGAHVEDAARAGVRQAVKTSAGGSCAATNAAVQLVGTTRATWVGLKCNGGSAYCMMDEPPLSMGALGDPTTVTLTCLTPPTPNVAVDPTWRITVTVDYASPLGRRMPWMPATPPAGSTTTIRYRTILHSN
jgi:Flp pilus assembly protein TadG